MIERHEVVSHYNNVNVISRLVWWKDATATISFEPMIASGYLDPSNLRPGPRGAIAGSAVVHDLICRA